MISLLKHGVDAFGAHHYVSASLPIGGNCDDNLPSAPNDNSASDILLDQYYTHPTVAEHCYRIFKQHFNPLLYQMVEPTAGDGSFLKLLPPGTLAYDKDPRWPRIQTADFLTIRIASYRPIAVIGNPPFGKNASLAVRIVNHAASQAVVIAMILPRSIRKASIQNRIDRSFHLIREEEIPDHAFLFRGKPFDVPAVFQIWVRRPGQRALIPVETSHPDFEFTIPQQADFAVQRVGARAGRVHHDFDRSPNSHYFIRGNVESIMKRLNYASVVGNVAGNPSLSRAELISLYKQAKMRT